MSKAAVPADWFVYMIKSSDDSLYTGITTDVKRRLQEHGEGKVGAKYFRGREPLRVVYQEGGHDRSSATRREVELKRLTRAQKLELVAQATN
ncbi:MAG: GIY-YIG nuclease family protein [Pseudomonadales bacterium]